MVALGGGHGLASTLKAVRTYAGKITAIVSVADDGGSSGRLRQASGLPAPGDLRRCLVALGDESSPWTRAFEYRFDSGELEGHALGNLIITGLAAATGDFGLALVEAARLVNATGAVLPATIRPVTLRAEIDGREVLGQARLAYGGEGPISVIELVPPDPAPPPEALEAIVEADQVVIGPGSLFTSVLAVAIVPAIRRALAERHGGRVYVCNLRPQVSETEGFDAQDHLDALVRHRVPIDVVVYDPAAFSQRLLEIPAGLEATAVPHALARADGLGHDPALLASVLARLAPRMTRTKSTANS